MTKPAYVKISKRGSGWRINALGQVEIFGNGKRLFQSWMKLQTKRWRETNGSFAGRVNLGKFSHTVPDDDPLTEAHRGYPVWKKDIEEIDRVARKKDREFILSEASKAVGLPPK
jgi:hypothetical protein